jgi:CHAT domain-containing protein
MLFDAYLALVIDSSADEYDAAFASLEALDRLRNLGLRSEFPVAESSGLPLSSSRSNQLREAIAQRESADSLVGLEQAQRNIDLLLLESGKAATRTDDSRPQANLRSNLQALPDDWSLLTYHLAENKTLAWTGSRDGLQLHILDHGEVIRGLLTSARDEVRTVNSDQVERLLAELGAKLFQPIESHLRHNILFFGAGGLNDFPLEALVVNGQFLIEQHRIQNVLSLANLELTLARIEAVYHPQRIFLAGNPETPDTTLPSLPGSELELQNVAETFPDATRQLFSGKQLNHAAFNDPSFDSADLVHIASHASIDIAYPELSRIELSEGILTPADLLGRRTAAGLVVLSACNTAGFNRFEYDSQLGFVSEFLNAGAGQVLATLWPVPDRATGDMIAALYAEIARNRQVGEALRAVKLDAIDAGVTGVDRWSAFQLFME